MFIKLGNRAAPVILLVLSSLWMAATVFPFFYSLLFPNADIQHVVGGLEGKETLSGDMARLVQQVTGSVGQLKRAIPIAAYFSAEYKMRTPHTTKTTEVSYLAWFKKRSRPTILVVTRTEVESSWVRVNTDEGTLFGAARLYLLPVSFMGFWVYWFRRKRSFDATIKASEPLKASRPKA